MRQIKCLLREEGGDRCGGRGRQRERDRERGRDRMMERQRQRQVRDKQSERV